MIVEKLFNYFNFNTNIKEGEDKVIFYYYYELSYYIDCTKFKAKGITYGVSWAEVMSNIVECYGENDIDEIYCLKPIGNGGSCIEIKEMQEDDILKEIKEINYE